MDVTTFSRVNDELALKCRKLFIEFLENFEKNESKPYMEALQELIKPERNTITIDFRDLEEFNDKIAQAIQQHYYRLYPFLCQAVQESVRKLASIPEIKEFYVSFSNIASRFRLRELSSFKIGSLVRITAQVVRTHPVHPELVSATFTCADCNTVISNVPQQFKYTQPTVCRNAHCSNRSRFNLNVLKSSFVDFQKIRVQEIQSELPRGSIPRNLDVILRAENVETAQAGDKCDFIGCLIVVPDVGSLSLPGARAESNARLKVGEGYEIEGVRGLKALGVRDLNYRLSFLACHVVSLTERFRTTVLNISGGGFDEIRRSIPDSTWQRIYEISRDRHLFSNLSSSLFPSIYGCDEIKKGILLMLFGGVPKTTVEGTSLRGDINICIVGDPSTAKSQFLRQLAEFAPRSVYTSGKASSAAGLTAAVVKDEDSFEFVIEAGALMLADNGICCIDEFDKMDPKDQVAIHEAMEQQTISIAKAGVKATLNARTSILAAANPINGRYDRSRSLRQNLNLTAPIMSRFDLFFILVDECNEIIDYAVAQQIVRMHSKQLTLPHAFYSFDEIKTYISVARLFNPKITKQAQKFIIEEYKKLRMKEFSYKSSWRITVRQLESIIRLSEAVARMYCVDEVRPKHVKEALNLLNKSLLRVEQPDIFLATMAEEMEAETVHSMDLTQEAMSQVSEVEEVSDIASVKSAEPNRLRLSFEEYTRIARMLIAAVQKADDEGNNMRKNDLVSWYLKEIESEIGTEAELIRAKTMIERVIDRLISVDHVFILISSREGVTREQQRLASQSSVADAYLIVHPNFDITAE